ncbi:MAG: hypothetical protein JJT85_00680 [Chromatiales bacterium]|nr:hypothetical protein [Chromatiales bacterium]
MRISLLILVGLLGSGSAAAEEDRLEELIELLAGQGLLAPEDAERLRAARTPDATTRVSMDRGLLAVESVDGEFAFRLGGRIHFDANWYDDPDGFDFGSGSQLRRAWLELDGRLWRHWEWKFAYNFADSGRSGFQDLLLDYTGLPNTTLRLGHFKEPLGLELLAASNHLTFMERALPTALLPSRSIGLGVYYQWDQATAAFGLFGEGLDKISDTGATAGLDEGWAASGRLTWTPVRSADQLLHLGASGSFRKANDLGGTQQGTPLRIRQRPEAQLTSIRLVDTGDSIGPVDDIGLWALEAAWVHGPLSLQAEYMSMLLARDLPGAPDLRFSGWYAYGSWILTGESRRYNFSTGRFSNPRVNRPLGRGGYGAWEVALRYSQLDLNSRVADPSGVIGGEQQNLTFGINWYPNDNLRLMLNWVKVLDVDRPGSQFDGIEPNIVQLRAQTYW